MGRVGPLMLMASICQEFGWTYDEYLDQPDFFLQAVREKMLKDRKREELALKSMKHVR